MAKVTAHFAHSVAVVRRLVRKWSGARPWLVPSVHRCTQHASSRSHCMHTQLVLARYCQEYRALEAADFRTATGLRQWVNRAPRYPGGGERIATERRRAAAKPDRTARFGRVLHFALAQPRRPCMLRMLQAHHNVG